MEEDTLYNIALSPFLLGKIISNTVEPRVFVLFDDAIVDVGISITVLFADLPSRVDVGISIVVLFTALPSRYHVVGDAIVDVDIYVAMLLQLWYYDAS